MAIELPEQGFVFWPVGTGDSTTIRVNEDTYFQVDLRHMTKSEEDEDTAWPIIEDLVDLLPQVDGKPYLSTFALTHPDLDHCQGFEALLEEITISELWMSPRVFREFQEDNDLCDDAVAFHDEAMRRVKETIDAGGDPGSGDRIRIIGFDELLKEADFKAFPHEFFSVPGHEVTELDAEDLSGQFRAFIHAPFKDDSEQDRNDCSLAFQISLTKESGTVKALLMGDLKYPTVRRIFDESEEGDLEWNILLAPHHCSKSVMYVKEEGKEGEVRKEDIIDDLSNASLNPGYIIASSEPIPDSNEVGDNPPHAKAKEEYEMIAPTAFICTHEHVDEDDPQPVIFEVTDAGLTYSEEADSTNSMSDTLAAAGVAASAPSDAVGFGYGAK